MKSENFIKLSSHEAALELVIDAASVYAAECRDRHGYVKITRGVVRASALQQALHVLKAALDQTKEPPAE
ncbi:MAG: hypothetical protein AB7L09_02945 [Nitrospira sp.]